MKISQRRGSPKACCAIATEVGVVLAFFVQQKLKEISQACLNKDGLSRLLAFWNTCLTLKCVCLCVVDNDLQGTDGSGALGGPDVRRRIPIKLLTKQTVRSKPPARPQRPTARLPSNGQINDETFTCKQEERFECKAGDAFGKQRRFPHPLFWDFKLNLVGEKDDTPVHFCDKCGLPIKIYGRMIPCKHVFCYDCAVLYEKKSDKTCPGCTEPVQRIEQCQRGSLYMCSIVQGCKRTYLSQRDLQAHINHRHMRVCKPGASRAETTHPTPALTPTLTSDPPDRFRLPPPPHLPKSHTLIPPPLQGHDPYGQPPPVSPSPSDLGPSSRALPPETFRIATVTTRKHSNLITVPIQDDSGSSIPSPREPLPPTPPGLPPHHHPGQAVVSHPHHIMPPPQQQHYGPPPPPPPPLSHPMQATGAPHMVYNQAPPMSAAPPPITPPPGHIINQMPPFLNHPLSAALPQHGAPPVSAPPPHHFNPNSLSQDQGTLSPPFNQPGALSPGLWTAARVPHPPRMQGPPQGQMPGPHHPEQARYRPYYQ
ncbi:E3 ubiquitin-protein ligase Hakai isoform X2 [Ictalurus punctatus]|uniref:E3 ubiquitin-protein ligase Hakai n=1 Tax=Ictalurus punctatus TaxID=7998 RepID=A0A2D0RJ39_ICTPU|nr:E3 ubiquitin-protein ligase Hakai isoform X2 [Ictalurus punctatus]